jgi:hypothetical protein
MAKRRTHAVVADMYAFGGEYLTFVLAVGTKRRCEKIADSLVGGLVYSNAEVVTTCQEMLEDWDASDGHMLYLDYEEEDMEEAA